MKDLSCLFLITTVLNLMQMPGSDGLRDVRLEAKRFIRRGEDSLLNCSYDLESETLYAVKFYIGQQEFYRFIPKEVPPGRSFPINGITVEVESSSDVHVLLRNVTMDLGKTVWIKCVVAAEFPFQTLSAQSDMTVVVIGDEAPSVELDRSQYHPGDHVSASCRSPPSYPPANITWLINGIKVDHELTKTDVRKDKDDPFAKSALSTISFDLPEKVSPVRIKCRATVFTAYDQSSNVTMIYPIPRRLTGTDTLLRAGSSIASGNNSMGISLTWCGILFIWIFFSK